MIIHEYGEIILCRNMTFEDNKLDMKKVHPGVVLLPTSENEDEVYCLYMTSNDKRADREGNKYIKQTDKVAKTSYINIQQIVKKMNNRVPSVNRLYDEQFKEILKQFYDYQMTLEPKKQEFLEIQSKIETLLHILDVNIEFNLQRAVSRREVDVLENITDERKRKVIYLTYALSNERRKNRTLKTQILTRGRDRQYIETLLKVYQRVRKVDFNNPIDEIRKIYTDLRSECYLINADTLLMDVSTIMNMIDDNGRNREIIEILTNFKPPEENRTAIENKNKVNEKENERYEY